MRFRLGYREADGIQELLPAPFDRELEHIDTQLINGVSYVILKKKVRWINEWTTHYYARNRNNVMVRVFPERLNA